MNRINTKKRKAISTSIETDIGRLSFAIGNSKISTSVAIISFGSGPQCQNRAICPYHPDNRKFGDVICYSNKGTGRFATVVNARNENRRFIESLDYAGKLRLAEMFVNDVEKYGCEYIRLNESGDIDEHNIDFALFIAAQASIKGIKTYCYTRSIDYVDKMRSVGINVRLSDTDTAVVDVGESKFGYFTCPGDGCGSSCKVCMETNSKVCFERH